MWQQTYTPLGSLGVSAMVAAAPIFVLLIMLAVLRRPAWLSSLCGLVTALAVALWVYGMPAGLAFSSILYGAAFGWFPIGWIVLWAIVLYRLTLETGKFEIIKDSIGGLTRDARLQALLIAFAFGAFLEGAAGFGTPVAVAAAMLAGLGFSPFKAAAICLLANTAPVAFGSIGIPLVTLQGITKLPLHDLSADVGRVCAPVSLLLPAYLIIVMSGWKALKGVLPAALLCGVAFASSQFLVSSYLGPYLTDIIGSLASICALIILLQFWKPAELQTNSDVPPHKHPTSEVLLAWAPYGLLVVFVLLWGWPDMKVVLNKVTQQVGWPGLHGLVQKMPPIVGKPTSYDAFYKLDYLSASGTACMLASFASAAVLRISIPRFFRIFAATIRQLALPLLTIGTVVGLAFLMNYCGATVTLGLAFAATGAAFPFFSSLLGWLGVFLTGSDTSANALFGNLQVVTANALGLKPALMAASNSSGGVMGKMISLQSIAVACAATGMSTAEESKLFRFTLRHSLLLATIIGLIVLFYSYVAPGAAW